MVNTGTKHESGLPPATIYDHVHCSVTRYFLARGKAEIVHEYSISSTAGHSSDRPVFYIFDIVF